MKFMAGPTIFVFTILVGTALALVVGPAPPAFACTIGPPEWSFFDADEIFEGRVLSAVENEGASDQTFRTFDLTVEVTLAHRGVTAGAVLPMQARVPRAVPLMCPQFDRDETLVGKYFVTSWRADQGSVRQLAVIPFFGPDPEGPGYERVRQLIRVVLGTDPTLPRLEVFAASASCKTTLTVVGNGFEPGQTYQIWGADITVIDGHLPYVTIGGDGRFVYRFERSADSCEGAGQFVEVGDTETHTPLAMAPLKDLRVGAPAPPDAGNSQVDAQEARLPSAWFAILASSVLVALVGARHFANRTNHRS